MKKIVIVLVATATYITAADRTNRPVQELTSHDIQRTITESSRNQSIPSGASTDPLLPQSKKAQKRDMLFTSRLTGKLPNAADIMEQQKSLIPNRAIDCVTHKTQAPIDNPAVALELRQANTHLLQLKEKAYSEISRQKLAKAKNSTNPEEAHKKALSELLKIRQKSEANKRQRK